MTQIIKYIRNIFTNETTVEAVPYVFEKDQPIEGFNDFYENLKTWRSKK